MLEGRKIHILFGQKSIEEGCLMLRILKENVVDPSGSRLDEYAGTCGEKKVGYSIITDVEGFLKKRRRVQIKSDEYRRVLIGSNEWTCNGRKVTKEDTVIWVIFIHID